MIPKKKLKAILSELRERFKALYGDTLHRMILYGSQARGDSEVGSDFDVLVVLEGFVRPYEEIVRTEGIVAEISLKYDVAVACMFVSRDRYETHRSPLLLNVHREGILL